MRYLIFVAAVLASAPAYAQFTDTIVLSPGFTARWRAPRAFKQVIIGDPDIIDVVQGQTDRQLIITRKRPTKPGGPTDAGGTTDAGGGTANILLLDANGDQVANLLVTNPGLQYELKKSPNGIWQIYRQAPPSP